VIDRKRQRDLDYQMVSTMFKEEAPRVPQRSIDLIKQEQVMQQKAEEAKELKAAHSVNQGETPFTSVSGSVDKVPPKVQLSTPRRLEPVKGTPSSAAIKITSALPLFKVFVA
jgi:hypothetical protein